MQSAGIWRVLIRYKRTYCSPEIHWKPMGLRAAKEKGEQIMNTDFLKGVIVPIITPIDENELIDEKALREQVDYVIEGGVHGILAFGSNGEFYVIEEDEIGAISTKKCVRLARMAAANGAAGISVLQPMFLKPTEAELFGHFKAIADAVPDTPVLLYNNPGRVGYTMSGNLVDRLAHEVKNIVGMKDTSGDMTQTSEFIRRTRDVGFKVFGGKDTLLYASLCHGAVGGQLHAGADHGYLQQICGRRSGRLPGGTVQAQPGPPVHGRGQLPGCGKGYGKPAGKKCGAALYAQPAHPGGARAG